MSPDEQERQARRKRWQEQLALSLDAPLAVLALVFLALIIVEFTVDLDPEWSHWVTRAEIAIWGVFFADFFLELAIAPSKREYLKGNWLIALSVTLPFFGFLRFFRAARALRGLRFLRGMNLLRAGAALNRGGRALGHFARSSRYGYVVALTALVVLTSAAIVYYFERDASTTDLTSFGEALWWSATIVTTINAQLETVTVEGRIVGFLLRVFGMAVISYITATVAVFLLGRLPTEEGGRSQMDELRQLREDTARLRQLLESSLAEQTPRTEGSPEE